MDLYDALVEAGVDVSNHYSDLYCPINDKSNKVIEEWKKTLSFKPDIKTFKNNVTGQMCYDIPFEYKPYWLNIQEKTQRH